MSDTTMIVSRETFLTVWRERDGVRVQMRAGDALYWLELENYYVGQSDDAERFTITPVGSAELFSIEQGTSNGKRHKELARTRRKGQAQWPTVDGDTVFEVRYHTDSPPTRTRVRSIAKGAILATVYGDAKIAKKPRKVTVEEAFKTNAIEVHGLRREVSP